MKRARNTSQSRHQEKTDYITSDRALLPFRHIMVQRSFHVKRKLQELRNHCPLTGTPSNWHLYYGLHCNGNKWIFREWLPNASEVWLIGDFSKWKISKSFKLSAKGNGDFEGIFPANAIKPGQQFRLSIKYGDQTIQRIPSAATELARNTFDLSAADVIFNAVVNDESRKYIWKHPAPARPHIPLIYEAHVGMAQEKPGIGTFSQFKENILPRIAEAGYNTVQLMGIMEHPYYASFGYHVTNFFAINDLLGTPDEFKELVDAAHALNLCVTMDLVHSHSAPNTIEGLSEMDGTPWQYFHDGQRGWHPAWGSRCFDYGKPQVMRFLLSNCRFWLEEYNLDGFRFDGVTSMLFQDHGLGHGYWTYDDYFSPNTDWDALAYLTIANMLIKQIKPDAITVAEEVSDFPGMNAAFNRHGAGFDYRLAMGIPDLWFKFADIRDEDWSMGKLLYELTSRRMEEHAISYVESHDQALVGGQTFFFRLAGDSIYNGMGCNDQNMAIDRAMSLHKMSRLITFATADKGYLNFMGNEFGHPEWVDFPREHNGWSFQHARRQWSLNDDSSLKFHFLSDFDKVLTAIVKIQPDFFNQHIDTANCHEEKKLISFHRQDLLFVFNFHPTASYTDLEIQCHKGKYTLLFNTDESRFGGFDRILSDQYFLSEKTGNMDKIKIYLPSRTAMVLKLAE